MSTTECESALTVSGISNLSSSPMPPRRNQRTYNVDDFSPNRRRIERLIERVAGGELAADVLIELGEMVARDDDLAILRSRLDRLGGSTTLHTVPVGCANSEAFHSLLEFAAVFQALYANRQSENARRHLLRCYPLLLERWTSITVSWTRHLLHSKECTEFVVHHCVALLRSILSAGPDSDEPYQEELATTKSTLDLFFALLCQSDAQSGHTRYCYVKPVDPSRPCQLIELVVWCSMSPVRSMAMADRLQAMKPRTRNTIVKALMERAEQLCQLAIDESGPRTVGHIRTFGFLLKFMTELLQSPVVRTVFERLDYLRRLATSLQAISTMARKAGYTNDEIVSRQLSNAMLQLVSWVSAWQPNPSSPSLLELMTGDGHIFKIAATLPSDTPTSASSFLKTAARLLPYLHSSEAFHTANTSGFAKSFSKVIEGLSGSAGTDHGLQDVAANYPKCLRYLEETFTVRKDRSIHICHNLAHLSRSAQSGKGEKSSCGAHLIMRACSRCRSVAYCSNECQREDWVLHTSECPILASQYYEEKRLHYWVSSRLKYDYLRILDTMANLELPPPPEFNYQYMENSMESLHDFPIGTFRFASQSAAVRQRIRTTVREIKCTRWLDRAMEMCNGRMENYVRKVRACRDTTSLVYGEFIMNSARIMMVFAQMKYDAEALEGYRYTILSSFFCIVDITRSGSGI